MPRSTAPRSTAPATPATPVAEVATPATPAPVVATPATPVAPVKVTPAAVLQAARTGGYTVTALTGGKFTIKSNGAVLVAVLPTAALSLHLVGQPTDAYMVAAVTAGATLGKKHTSVPAGIAQAYATSYLLEALTSGSLARSAAPKAAASARVARAASQGGRAYVATSTPAA